MVLSLALLFPVGALGFRWARGPQFVATVAITPDESERPLAQVAGLAAQLGLSIGGGGDLGNSVPFYTALLSSYDILTQAVTSEFAFVPQPRADTVRLDLVALFDRGGRTRADSIYRAVRYLERKTEAADYRDAGVVRLTTVADSPGLAVAVAERLIELVAEYNQDRRQSRARAERVFVEARLAETGSALDEAEKALEAFRRTNRQTLDPGLELSLQRLIRTVSLHEQSYLQLSGALEQSRISEVRDIPVFSVLESPANTVRRVEGFVRDTVVWTLFGLTLGIIGAFGMTSYRSFVLWERR
jgi:uncharacterized protein involved in exopolysaccharide biosynthesis